MTPKLFPKLSEIAKQRMGEEDNLRNAIASTASYAISPILAVISAPILLAGLGLEGFGLWGFANSVSGTLTFATYGLGDGVINSISAHRTTEVLKNGSPVTAILRSALAIHTVLGSTIALLVALAAPFAARLIEGGGVPFSLAVSSIRLSGLLIGIRAIDAVFGAALRGLQRYDITAKVAMVTQGTSIVCASVVAIATGSVPAVLATQCAVWFVGLLAHGRAWSRFTGSGWIVGSPERRFVVEILTFGRFSWLQSIGSVLFSQIDRILVGALLGPASLGIYTLGTLIAQQGQAIGGAAFHFVFPLTRGWSKDDMPELVRLVGSYDGLNLSGIAVYGVFSITVGSLLLQDIAEVSSSQALYTSIALGLSWTLLGANTLPYYVLMGLGQIRFVASTTLIAGVLTLAAIGLLAPPFGVVGASAANGVFGLVSILYRLRMRSLVRVEVADKKP